MATMTGAQRLLFHNAHRRYVGDPPPPPSTAAVMQPMCGLSKQGHRFFTSIATANSDDPALTNRLIRKFVASSSKSVALNALSHLLSPTASHLSSLAFPLYSVISKALWFDWNPKLIADVIALLYKREQFDEADLLLSEAVSKVGVRERDLCTFYCYLIDSHSKRQSLTGMLDSYQHLQQLPSHSSSVYLQKRAYESMVGGLCVLDLPQQGEELVGEMKSTGLKPSAFQYRSIIYSYGRLGLFQDMKRVISLMEDDGFGLDVVCSNMVLSSLGTHGELSEMTSWLKRMKGLGIPFSIRTYNSVLNSCPTIMSMVQNPKSIPTSIEELMENLCGGGDEALLVQELIETSVLDTAVESTALELKLDLHGMHLGSAYLVMLQWFHELHLRVVEGNQVLPAEIVVVCGSGKNSAIRGESPVKRLVKEMTIQMKSPLRIDRKNVGCFVAKGQALVDWLSQFPQQNTRAI